MIPSERIRLRDRKLLTWPGQVAARHRMLLKLLRIQDGRLVRLSFFRTNHHYGPE